MFPIIYVAQSARVYIVEDNAERIAWFRAKLGDRIVGLTADPDLATEQLDKLDAKTLDAIFLDYDLGPEQTKDSTITSKPVVEYLNERFTRRADQGRIIIHSQNVPGARWINALLPGAIRLPFGDFDIQDR
jgi:hypothetical protein